MKFKSPEAGIKINILEPLKDSNSNDIVIRPFGCSTKDDEILENVKFNFSPETIVRFMHFCN